MANDFQEALDRHNLYRRRHGVPPLQWDRQLAEDAQDYANRRVFGHDSQLLRTLGEGENLAINSSATAATDIFYNEIHLYDYNHPGFSHEAGHFTQLVWRNTTRIGIGMVRWNNAGQGLYVFRYSDPGNVTGQFPANVLRPGATSSATQAPPSSPPHRQEAAGQLCFHVWCTKSSAACGQEQGLFGVHVRQLSGPRITAVVADYNHHTFNPQQLQMTQQGNVWSANRRSWGYTVVKVLLAVAGRSGNICVQYDAMTNDDGCVLEYHV